MKELTNDEIKKIWNADVGPYGWMFHQLGPQNQVIAFAHAILAKYAQPSKREIIERERKAFDKGCGAYQSWRYECPAGMSGNAYIDDLRDKAYPLPTEEPAPVLTDEEINAAWRDEHTLPLSYFDASRKIERAVLAKLAEQKP